MQTFQQITAQLVKERISPEKYYSLYLKGAFGKHTGNNWYAWNGLCPFHHDRKPGSLYINKETGSFKCFSCGAKGGDIFDFHKQLKQLPFKNAFDELKEVARCEK